MLWVFIHNAYVEFVTGEEDRLVKRLLMLGWLSVVWAGGDVKFDFIVP